ncbi:sulfite transporter ssu1 [Diplodia corticola]|uniref:Sulfite efflux pump SSU1 n=1 Tax=Diplodia corticola TaxID=236234 RepID=A0A1J9RSE1_9PEZI|nr:sulfite transporter ssu1 [Diplodia corticola]OJD30796.1 sulfite transporter ssu1 [Diplodia corticola]
MDPSVETSCNAAEIQTPCPNAKYKHGWRRIVRNFTPSWFSVNMGTGIVSILLHNLPYNAVWLYWISVALFILNVLLFTTFLAITTLRYVLYPRIWSAMINHPVQSLFLGTFPMALATIINMIVFVCVPIWGHRAVHVAWSLWWLDAALSLATCTSLPFATMTLHARTTSLASMTAAWLLPVVATIVAAASGGIVAEVLGPNRPDLAATTLVASYVLWGAGVPLACVVLAMYFHRLALEKLPPADAIVSVFLPLGPLGQGGFGIMQLGRVARDVFPVTGTLGGGGGGSGAAAAGDVLYVVGWLAAVVMWGFGLVWLIWAVASVASVTKNSARPRARARLPPFNIGWWGFTFPLGVFAASTATMGEELPSRFFAVLGTALSCVVAALWVGVAAGTARRAWSGEMFFSPCVKGMEEKVGLMRGVEGVEVEGEGERVD